MWTFTCNGGYREVWIFWIGKKCKPVTDHKALLTIETKPEFGSKLMQILFSCLERFQCDVEYRQGDRLIAADALSRNRDKPKSNVYKTLQAHWK